MPITDAVHQELAAMEERMKGRIATLLKEYSLLRTGRASPQLVEPVKVEAYGQSMPLKSVAAISVPEARVLEIRPWDPSVLNDIEKALQKANLGAMPQSDGKIIRVSFPAMTEERRQELVKVVKRMAEERRVAVRGDRQETLEKFKKAEKSKELSQDELRDLQGRVQKTTDAYVAKVDQEAAGKEKEITAI